MASPPAGHGLPITDWSNDADQLKALGHGALALVNGGIILAIIALVLSSKSGTANVLQTALAFVTWLVSQVVRPISGGQTVTVGSKLLPTGSYGTSTGAPAGAADTGGSDASTWDIPSAIGTTGAGAVSPTTSSYGDIPTMTITP